MSDKPTIAELEAILNEPDGLRVVVLNPDGSLRTELTNIGKYVDGIKFRLSDTEKRLATAHHCIDCTRKLQEGFKELEKRLEEAQKVISLYRALNAKGSKVEQAIQLESTASRYREALKEAIYEVTHLSPMPCDENRHTYRPQIKSDVVERWRAALNAGGKDA